MWRNTIGPRDLGNGLLSALDPEDEGAHYDRRAAAYDLAIRTRTYNRLAWRTAPADYTAFAREALADGVQDLPLLDAGAGTAAATATLYRETARPVVLADRSTAMLRKAMHRVGDVPHVTAVQCDMTDPPFAPGSFGTVACHGVLHCIEDAAAWVAGLRELTAGRVFLSSLVVPAHRFGRGYMRALHRAGEFAAPRTRADLEDLLGTDVRCRGAMAYAVLSG